MTDWPSDLMSRRFAPREVAHLTGVDEARQRLIAQRYFDFRESIAPVGKQRRWLWQGVQALAVFSDAMEDMQKFDVARAMARLDDEDAGELIYHHDCRENEEDTLIVYHFGNSALQGASISTPSGVQGLYAFANERMHPARIYLINLSDIQRRLYGQLETMS